MSEKWKSLKGIVELGEFYEISNLGNVRSVTKEIVNSKGVKRIYFGKVLKLTKK